MNFCQAAFLSRVDALGSIHNSLLVPRILDAIPALVNPKFLFPANVIENIDGVHFNILTENSFLSIATITSLFFYNLPLVKIQVNNNLLLVVRFL